MTGQFTYNEIILTYEVTGEGSDPILTFHGFGQNAGIFGHLSDAIKPGHRIYSFNLFFHGSHWPYGDRPLEIHQLTGLFSSFLKKEGIGRFSLAGYSIGARLATALVPEFQDRIMRLYLIAPDGIKTNFWYSLATGSSITRKWFRNTATNPGLFLALAEWTGKMGIIHPSALRFARSQMGNEEKRKKVYYTWMNLRKIFVSPEQLAGAINKNGIPVIIWLGENDKIINVKNISRLTSRLEELKIVNLSVNHHQLIDGWISWIRDHPGEL